MLTEWEERVLDVMCERRYAYPGEVAEDAEVSRAEAERILEQLADLGYVKRLNGRHGRRYQITAAGREAAVRRVIGKIERRIRDEGN